MLNEIKPVKFSDPNKYAPKPQREYIDNIALIHGYQDFVVTPHSISISNVSTVMLERKYQLIRDYLRAHYAKERLPDLKRQTFLDIGGNGGFFCFWASLHNADKAVSIDLDLPYVEMVNEVALRLDYQNVEAIHTQVDDWNQPSDIVLALAMVHWLYSCTEVYGSLDQVIGKLASVTSNVLFVEWVDPADSAIQFFHHIEYNPEFIQGPYTREAFEKALANHFSGFQVIGDVSPTRVLYAATVKQAFLELGGPMPLLHAPDKIISSRFLSNINSVEYWSRVYKAPYKESAIKQSSFDLGQREFYFLKQLDSNYFPHAYSSERNEGYSTVEMEFIVGEPFVTALPKLQATFDTVANFFRDCLNLLGELQNQQISHRDISINNILVRDGKPVLLDFGWAETAHNLVDTLPGMGGDIRPRDNVFDDTYGIGQVLKKVIQPLYPQFYALLGLMLEENRSLRVTNAHLLQLLLELLLKENLAMTNSEPTTLTPEEKQLSELSELLYKNSQRLNVLKTELLEKQNTITIQNQTIENLTKNLSDLHRNKAQVEETLGRIAEAERSASEAKQQAFKAEQRAALAEEKAATWWEKANQQFKDLQALQGTRTVKVSSFLGNIAHKLKR